MKRGIVLAFAGCMAGAVAAQEFEYEMAGAHEPSPEVAAYNDAMNAHIREVLDALIERDSAQSLKWAGLMVAGRQPPESCDSGMGPGCAFAGVDSESVLLRAVAANPEDAVLLWAAALDPRLDEADRAAIVDRLQQLRGDNAAVWLLSLPDPVDGEGVEEILAAAATSGRHHLFYNDRLRAYDEAFRAHDLPPALTDIPDEFEFAANPENARMLLVLSLALADTLPGFEPLFSLCRDSEGRRRAHCLKLARTMAFEGDTLLGTRIGLAILRTLDPTGPAGLAREREIDWWSTQVGMFSVEPERYGVLYMEESRKPGATEISVLREITRRIGVPLQPPAQWESQREHSRRLYGS